MTIQLWIHISIFLLPVSSFGIVWKDTSGCPNCIHGTCDTLNGVCTCKQGVTGFNCNQDINECETDMYSDGDLCGMHGTCYNIMAGYRCYCSIGFIGEHCEILSPLCNSDVGQCTAKNSICSEKIVSKACKCTENPRSYHSETCEIDESICKLTDCIMNGVCETVHRIASCYCDGDASCGKVKDECEPNPCKNNGKCVAQMDNSYCKCEDGFEGRQCQYVRNPCVENPCKNGATCQSNGDGTYVCFCVLEHEYGDCGPERFNCQPGYCKNGAICRNNSEGVSCICEGYFVGVHCELVINSCENDPCGSALCYDNGYNYTCGEFTAYRAYMLSNLPTITITLSVFLIVCIVTQITRGMCAICEEESKNEKKYIASYL